MEHRPWVGIVAPIRAARRFGLLLAGGIVDQHAMNHLADEVAAVVPDLVVLVAGNREEARRHPLVLNARWWPLFRKEGRPHSEDSKEGKNRNFADEPDGHDRHRESHVADWHAGHWLRLPLQPLT